MEKKGKLELTWVGKYEEEKLEPRILIEDKSKSYGDPDTENMLIHGDNLLALKALEIKYRGQVKCVYIDPPYNTGNAFEQYDDGLEHSLWLTLIKQRLEILKGLLAEDGSIWISIDDDEQAYLKVLCDEVFGRTNFISNIIWEKKYSPQNDAKWFSDSHDFIIVYARNKNIWRPNLLERSGEMNARYKNPDNDPRGPWKPSDFSVRTYNNKCDYPITLPSGRIVKPPASRAWVSNKETFEALKADNRIWFGPKGDSVPSKKKFLSEVKQGMTAMTIWKYMEVGHNQDAKKEAKAFNSEDVFATPKPEKLVQRIIHLATNPGDIVLDSFLGSGTTIAVAQKMNRSWIGIELGDQCITHCKPRIDMVIDGEQGGISKDVNWQGGGGYKFYELAEPLLVKNTSLPIYQINPTYTWDMVCEAICKIEGFTYDPSGKFQGYSSENRFIHITQEFVNTKYIMSVMKSLGERQSLLIYCKKNQAGMIFPENVEVKKIPKDLLDKCNFKREVQE